MGIRNRPRVLDDETSFRNQDFESGVVQVRLRKLCVPRPSGYSSPKTSRKIRSSTIVVREVNV
jgi:hypothetical protein